MGEVYMALVQCCLAKAKAYSATTVFPALVCAATKTELPCSKTLQSYARICQHAGILLTLVDVNAISNPSYTLCS